MTRRRLLTRPLPALALAVPVLSASAAGDEPPTVLVPLPTSADARLVGPRPVIRTPWIDLTTFSGTLGWWFQLWTDADGRVTRATVTDGLPGQRAEATRAALALRFAPRTPDDGADAREVAFLIPAENADYDGPPDRNFPARPDLRQASIALRRTACFGTCPSYRVEVRGDGLVSYRGVDHVVVEGVQQWRIDPAAAARLVDRFRQADYFRLDGAYVRNVTDAPTFVTRVVIDGRRKVVLDHAGAWSPPSSAATAGPATDAGDGAGEARPRMPAVVTALEDTIDEVSGVRSLVQGDDATMARLRQAHWDFRSPAAGRGLAQLVHTCRVALAKDFFRAGARLDAARDAEDAPTADDAARCGDAELVGLLFGTTPGR